MDPLICDHPPRLSPVVGKLNFALQVKIELICQSISILSEFQDWSQIRIDWSIAIQRPIYSSPSSWFLVFYQFAITSLQNNINVKNSSNPPHKIWEECSLQANLKKTVVNLYLLSCWHFHFILSSYFKFADVADNHIA